MLKDNTRIVSFSAFLICGLAAFFYVYDYFIQVAPSIMTEELMRSFSIDAAGIGILGASFFYSYTLMQIPAGLLIDRFGPRLILTIAVFLSALGVTIFGLTHSFPLAAFSRFIIGLGSSCAFISAIFLVARWLPHRYFAVSAGLIQLGGCLGSIFGEAPLAMVINHFGWRQVMLSIGLATFLLVGVYWWIIRDGKPEIVSNSHQGLQKNSHRFRYLAKKAQLWWVALAGLVCWVPAGVVGALWGVPYLMKIYGFDNVVAGKMMSLFWLGIGFSSPFFGWYSNRIGRRKNPLIICFATGLIAAVFIIFATHFSPWLIAIALFLLGCSAAVQSLTFSVIKDIIPPNAFGTASGIINMAAILGGGLSQTIVGFILRATWNGAYSQGIPVYTVMNYQIAFLILIVSAAVGLWVSLIKIKETHCAINYGSEEG